MSKDPRGPARGDEPDDPVDPTADTFVEPDSDGDPRSAENELVEARGPRYELGDPIGEGGMAVVYLATDRSLERTVAVKCLRDELAGAGEARTRFFDEARILGALGHPGAIPIHEAGRLPDGRLFYSMKKVEGRTLQDLLSARSPEQLRDRLEMLRFVDLFARICETMAAAHAEKIIHRDLKPDNVMIDEFGAVYVMDWGLAKRLEADGSAEESGRTRAGAVMGTPAYMSPEQASGMALHSDCQSDVFSLGVVLYEILTGENPFRASSARHAMKGVLYHDPEDPRKKNSGIDRALAAVCMKALAKDPYRRYPTARELVEDIRRFRRFLPVTATKQRMIDRLVYWARRRPGLAAMTGTIAVLAVMAGVSASVQKTVEQLKLGDAYDEMGQALGEIDKMELMIRDVTTRLADPSLGEAERQLLDSRFRLLRTLIDVERGAVMGAAWAMNVFDESGRPESLVRDDFLKMVNQAIAENDILKAYVLTNFVLGRQQRVNRAPRAFTPEDLAMLRDQRRMLAEQIDEAELSEVLEGIEIYERVDEE